MRSKPKLERAAIAQRLSRCESDEQRELALLAEFTRHTTVADLAGAIARRLGGTVRGDELIARADLDSPRRGT